MQGQEQGKTVDDGWKELDISMLDTLTDEVIAYLRANGRQTIGDLVQDWPDFEWVQPRWRLAVQTAYGRFHAIRSTSATEAAAESKGDQ